MSAAGRASDSRHTLPRRHSTGDGGGDRLTACQARELVGDGSATTTASRAAASELGSSSASCRATRLHLVRPSSSTGDGGCGRTSCRDRRSQSSVRDCYVERALWILAAFGCVSPDSRPTLVVFRRGGAKAKLGERSERGSEELHPLSRRQRREAHDNKVVTRNWCMILVTHYQD